MHTNTKKTLSEQIDNDPIYRQSALNNKTEQEIIDAGIFLCTHTSKKLQEIRKCVLECTPLFHIKKGLTHCKSKPIILVSTGGFAPIHEEHISSMEIAKKIAQDQGYTVVGGFITPDHDNYVSKKSNNANRLCASKRVALTQEALNENEWLKCDPWSAIYNKSTLNFTDIIVRTQQYVKYHLNQEITIGYVFGEDNKLFKNAFTNQNIIGIEIPRSKHNLSSTKIRKGQEKPLPEIQNHPIWLEFSRKVQPKISSNNYLIRDDLDWATSHIQSELKTKANKEFLQGLIDTINRTFNYSLNVKTLSTKIQQQVVNKIKKEDRLNNDIITGEDSPIRISRVFEEADLQKYAKNWDIQFDKSNDIKNKVFIDDDIASGSTHKKVASLLGIKTKCMQTINLAKEAFKIQYPNEPFDMFDIIDARDFLICAKHAGLMVNTIQDTVKRKPYLLPNVNLNTRAKIPFGKEIEFHNAILNLIEHLPVASQGDSLESRRLF